MNYILKTKSLYHLRSNSHVDYLIVTLPPAASNSFNVFTFFFSCSFFNNFGTLSTISFDSFNPNPVTLRTTFKIAIFLSAGTSVNVISNADFSSAASAAGAAPPAAGTAATAATETDVSTPKLSQFPLLIQLLLKVLMFLVVQ